MKLRIQHFLQLAIIFVGYARFAFFYGANFALAHDAGVSLLSRGIMQAYIDSHVDCNHERPTRSEESDKQGFGEGQVKIYRPNLFRRVRASSSVTEQEFADCISPENLKSMAADSKSGLDFWFSHDGKFFVKTMKKYECRNLKSALSDYDEHVSSGPTCIAPVLGLFRIKTGWFSKRYFMVTRNVFPPLESGSNNQVRYDLKGSTVGRTASLSSKVKKDVDLTKSGNVLNFGDSKLLVLEALIRDVQFLQKHRFMDYSLLVAVEDSPIKNMKRFAMTNQSLIYSLKSMEQDDG